MRNIILIINGFEQATQAAMSQFIIWNRVTFIQSERNLPTVWNIINVPIKSITKKGMNVQIRWGAVEPQFERNYATNAHFWIPPQTNFAMLLFFAETKRLFRNFIVFSTVACALNNFYLGNRRLFVTIDLVCLVYINCAAMF